ncbi:MAG: AraC family transcriptional regulator [Holophagaceae bacterium]|nr:AraC family transcriptional regulator [Holophagaceae bacterium]
MEALPSAQHVVIYHLVVHGACEVALGDETPRRVAPNHLIVIPTGEPHILGSDLVATLAARRGAKKERVVIRRTPDGAPEVRQGGGGAETRLICGYLACDSALFTTILGTLPKLMVVNLADDAGGQWLTSSLQFTLAESGAPKAGTGALLAKLSELMFVEAIRRHVEALPEGQQGWLSGLRDPFVGKALALLHSDPARAWTVEELARMAGLSRSALAERFAALLGQPPMAYLARWRMQLAADLLGSTQDTLAAIAEQVGYESEAAFSRAFKREMGLAPAGWRSGKGAARAS